MKIHGTNIRPTLKMSRPLFVVDQTIEAVLKAVQTTTGLNVSYGLRPHKMLARITHGIGADNEIASGVMIRALSATDAQFSWQLFYDPGLKEYAFNVHVVEAARR